ncbi:ankyrin repeat domain-containing protein 40-like [Oculina patagonica]
MANKTELEERLRELCCIGDERNAKLLIERGVSINTANAMNGWTPLHWAAKRGHASIVKYLVEQGADATALTSKGETAAQLSSDTGIKQMLGEGNSMGQSTVTETLPIVPNYLRNPEFFYAEKDEPGGWVQSGQGVSNSSNQESSLVNGQQKGTMNTNTSSNSNSSCAAQSGEEVVLKLRIADSEEKDFIELGLHRSNLTFQNLETVCCEELGIESKNIKKIRKLPNTIVRNDKDVTRLLPYQELEVVLTGDKS